MADVSVAILVSFLNEERLLPTFLASMAAQTRPPDRLLLVDDGSIDGSAALASAFAAEHDHVQVLSRPAQSVVKDRLAAAAELQSFHWAKQQLTSDYDVIAKMDADLRLSERHVESIVEHMRQHPNVGVCGTYLATERGGTVRRELHPASHVRGPTKFYRRACLDQIEPLPEILGWDTFDDIRARLNGWTTETIECPGGDSIHLRPTGEHDGRLRAYRRWGRCAWGHGAHPAVVVVGAAARTTRRPFGVSGLAFFYGYVHAAATRAPRIDPVTRRHGQREQLRELGTRARAALAGGTR